MSPALDSLVRRFGRRRLRAPERPLRDELLSIERLEERAKALAARLTVDPLPRRDSRDLFPRFTDNARVLRQAYLGMAEDVHQGEFVTPAAEWLLDNYHLVASEIRDVRQNLPRGYYRELPEAGHARARRRRARLRHGRGSDPPQRQPTRPAAAAALHEQLPDGRAADDRRAVGLAEHAEARAHRKPAPPRGGGDRGPRGAPCGRPLRRADRRSGARAAAGAARSSCTPRSWCSCCSACGSTARACRLCEPRSTSHLLAQRTAAEEAIRGEHQRQAAAQVSVANVITSLRLASTLDWSQYFEAVSLVEGVLQRDPAGVYGRWTS